MLCDWHPNSIVVGAQEEAKYRVLEIYNQKLYERYKKREMVVARDLMNIKRLAIGP